MPKPFATWDPSKATDLPDGLPDTKMVPLVEELCRRGYTTLQSCQGHPPDANGRNASDGHLWLDATDASANSLWAVCRKASKFCDTASLTFAQDDVGVLVRIVLVWPHERTEEVSVEILRLLTAPSEVRDV
jgi:hypothetical protein